MKITRKPGPAAQTLKVLVEGFGRKAVRVGFFPSSKYADGTPVALVATVQEFGSPQQGIPPRPFMRTAAAENTPKWVEGARQGAAQVLRGRTTPEVVLDAIGQVAAGDVRKAISEMQDPALKPSTIANRLRKRADQTTLGLLGKPLVDTGVMLNSVQYEVDDI